MKFSIYQESRIGKRRNNQDRIAYCYSREALCMVLADGMGGHLHGEIAAQIAIQYTTEAFQREAHPTLRDPVQFLSRTLSNAHHAIQDYAFDKDLPDAPRTTVVACIIQDNMACWAHAGDSRLYLLRGREILARTRDHSRVQLLLEQGLIDAKGAATHPARNRIYSCLGGSVTPQIDFSRRTPLCNGDTVVICSDGVWGPVGGDSLVAGIAAGDIKDSVPAVMNDAERLAGSNGDNLSMIAMTWREGSEPETPGLVSTRTMPADEFTTLMESFDRSHGNSTGKPESEISDNEIEQAISEINAAIQKFSK